MTTVPQLYPVTQEEAGFNLYIHTCTLAFNLMHVLMSLANNLSNLCGNCIKLINL